jgi:hypothetical protein
MGGFECCLVRLFLHVGMHVTLRDSKMWLRRNESKIVSEKLRGIAP